MQHALNRLKNSRFVNAICDQINRLPSPLVGLGMILAILAATVAFGCLLILLLLILKYVLFVIPYGIGVGLIGMAFHILSWREYNGVETNKHTKRNAYLIKQSVKLWSLAAVLGVIALSLYPMGRHHLFETQFFDVYGLADLKALNGIRIFAFGWLLIATPIIFRSLTHIPKLLAGFVGALSEVGSDAKNKCLELKDRNVSA